jgi:hypothetical protein
VTVKKICLTFLPAMILLTFQTISYGQSKNVIKVKGTGFEVNGKPFEFTGISFFNAIYNPEFNKDSGTRRQWIRKFNEYGINVFRIWCQWDNKIGFIDTGKDKTLYNADGTLNTVTLTTLKDLIRDADEEGTIVLLTLFSHESWGNNIRLTDEASENAVAEVARVLKPYRNIILQIWNEFNYRAVDYGKIIKSIDAERIVTNSPGFAGDLGSSEENRFMDYLSPHTTRNDNMHWEIALKEIGYLLIKYNKPVVDDEPARKGTPQYGGPKNQVFPPDHILHIYNVWRAGAYAVYHHDMFQTGYGSDAIPPNGIPAPGFSAYHDAVFDFLKEKNRYLKPLRK